jgi:VanZ family protein
LRAWGPAAAWAAVLFLLSAWANPPVPLWFPGQDKVAHVGLYGVLGLALAYGRGRAVPPPPHLLMILVGALYGATDELHQVFVAGRTPDPRDWLADITGLLVGYGLWQSLRRRRSHPSTEHTTTRADV